MFGGHALPTTTRLGGRAAVPGQRLHRRNDQPGNPTCRQLAGGTG